MKILHLSDTTLSGSPFRIASLFDKYTEHTVRHIVWEAVTHSTRVFPVDLIGSMMSREAIQALMDEADVIHYHNRWQRQNIFQKTGIKPPKKPSVIQIHSPRDSENFSEEIASGVPLAVIAQYHVRQWPELRFEIPNVVDIHDPLMVPKERPKRTRPFISYAPSSQTGKGWNDKAYSVVNPVLRRMWLKHEIIYDRIVNTPFEAAMARKTLADIGIDEVATGSYHLSSLEYLSMGVACFAHIDAQTEAAIKRVTGCTELPWIRSDAKQFTTKLLQTIKESEWKTLGNNSRRWMENFWNPQALCNHYLNMYEAL